MIRLITAPTEDVVTLAEARGQCRVDRDVTDFDADISRYLDAAVGRVDGGRGILGRCLRRQTWELVEHRFPISPASLTGELTFPYPYSRAPIRLPLPPTLSVSSVKYLDQAEVLQTLDPSAYRVIDGSDDEGAQIIPIIGSTWPLTAPDAPDALRVRFSAGYEVVSSPLPSPLPNIVPDPIRHAILLMVGSWYVNRSDDVVGTTVLTLPSGVESLLAPFRLYMEHEAV